MMKLHDLKPEEGSKQDRKRVGRGISAGQGKTAGRGTKGQGARSGGSTRKYHQGGNLPFFRRLPFVRGEGFTPLNRLRYSEVNLSQLKRFDANTVITPELLIAEGVVKDDSQPIVILGQGEIDKALTVRAHRVSKGARAKIEAAGGSVEIVEA
jgi:large subunit ribosomal protein L15